MCSYMGENHETRKQKFMISEAVEPEIQNKIIVITLTT